MINKRIVDLEWYKNTKVVKRHESPDTVCFYTEDYQPDINYALHYHGYDMKNISLADIVLIEKQDTNGDYIITYQDVNYYTTGRWWWPLYNVIRKL